MSNDAMIFYDNYEAPLTAGSYRFVLQQTVNLEGDEARHYYHDQRFEVLAHRKVSLRSNVTWIKSPVRLD